MIIGLVFAGVGIILLINIVYNKIKCNMTTTGRVVNIVKKTSRGLDGKIKARFFPIYEYEADRKLFEKKSTSSYSSTRFKEYVTIRYNPKNPDQYYVRGNYTKLILGVTFTIVGLIAMVTIHN